MRLFFLVLPSIGLGTAGLILGAFVSVGNGAPGSVERLEASSDPSGAQIQVHRQDETVRIQGVFINDHVEAGELRYELEVQRDGASGMARTTQSGAFATAPAQTDTLSTVHVRVESGDRTEVHLTIRREGGVVDETRRQLVF